MTERVGRRTGWRARWFGWVPLFPQWSRVRLRSQVRLMALAMLVGLVAGLGAIFFYVATQAMERAALENVVGYHPEPRPAGELPLNWLPSSDRPFRPWLLLIVPTIGGLLSGLIVYSLAPEAEGHGTDSVIRAYHYPQGEIRPRVPLVKIVASALTIGSGGSGGREGPIAQIGAGFGCYLANLLRLRPEDRRVLMAAGMAAGIAAIFRAPLAGTMFAAEVLYSSAEFESDVIIPSGIGSVVSYCVFGSYSGWQPLFAVPNLTFDDPWQLGPYLLLALFMIVLAMLYARGFYAIKAVFDRMTIPRRYRPALGALLTGLVGVGLYYLVGRQTDVLAVLAFGYSAIERAVTQDTTASVTILLAVALGKILTTGLTIGSGGSGGVFGPSMVIGGCGGGALGVLLHQAWPSLVPHPASFVVVGMAGFFAAAAKTPFSTLIIVSEMTGGYALLLPSLWVCTLSFIFSDAQSIYSAQVEGRAKSPAHQGFYARQVLADVRVARFLDGHQNLVVLRADDSLATVLARMGESDFPVLPVVDEKKRLLGVVNLEEAHLASQAPAMQPLVLAADLMRSRICPLTPEDRLDRALELFVENDLLALPVVADLEGRELVGMIRRFEIARRYLQYMHGPPNPGDGTDAYRFSNGI